MKIEIEIDDLIGYQVKSDENKVIHFEDMDKISFEYGAMSSRYRLYAENKYTAYAAMCCHFKMSAHLIALYEPVDVVKDDSWLNPFGAIADRLDEIYGGQGEFDKYFDSHIELIREAYETIEQIC